MSKDRERMEGSTKAFMWGSIVTVIVLGAVIVAVIVAVTLTVGRNDHSRIIRDQNIKVACVSSGQQMINDNCVEHVP